jgi:hypothetical protein
MSGNCCPSCATLLKFVGCNLFHMLASCRHRSQGDGCLEAKSVDAKKCPYRMQGVSGGPALYDEEVTGVPKTSDGRTNFCFMYSIITGKLQNLDNTKKSRAVPCKGDGQKSNASEWVESAFFCMMIHVSVYRYGTGSLTKTAEDVEGNCGQSGGAAEEEEEEEVLVEDDPASSGEEETEVAEGEVCDSICPTHALARVCNVVMLSRTRAIAVLTLLALFDRCLRMPSPMATLRHFRLAPLSRRA